RLTDDEAAAFVRDIHTLDAALPAFVAQSARGASHRDVTENAVAPPRWDDERAQRVREYLEHRSEEQYGAWIEDLAAHGLDDDSIEGDEVVFPDAYDRLPARLAEGLQIRLNHEVERIAWSAAGVEATTEYGTFSAP